MVKAIGEMKLRDLNQIDADCLDLPGLRIRARYKTDGLAFGDFIAFLQCGDVEENVRATVIGFDETIPLCPSACILL